MINVYDEGLFIKTFSRSPPRVGLRSNTASFFFFSHFVPRDVTQSWWERLLRQVGKKTLPFASVCADLSTDESRDCVLALFEGKQT
jgi:hypothetical protein